MRRIFVFAIVLAVMFSYAPQGFAATDEEMQALKAQVQELMQRIDKLETEQAQSKAEVVKAKEEPKSGSTSTAPAPNVDLANALSRLRIKGRWAAGYLKSGKAGSYPDGSFEAPEAKIQFSFQPDNTNTIVMRFNLNNATAQSPLLDYLYLQSKDFLPFLKDTPFSLNGRLGRFKLGFGEETMSNNMVEGVLPSNSAGNVGVSDEGIELAGKVKLDKVHLKPLGWVFSVSDGNSGVGSATSGSKAYLGKLYYNPIDPLYLSASYYHSSRLKSSNAEMSIAGLTSRPTGATAWDRIVWEVDARYDIGKGSKPLEPIAYSDSKVILRLSYGGFGDEVTGAAKRNGQFGFVEGTYNLTKRIYAATRYSLVDLDDGQRASLNGITGNLYQRYSLGLGWRWSENTILKFGYDWNSESKVTSGSKANDLLSAIVASQF